MEYLSSLKLLALSSAAVCLAALSWQVVRTSRFGRRLDPSVPAGSAASGIAYAFGPGMAPWAKESARDHPATWFAGVFYHLGVFAAFAFVSLTVMGSPLPAAVAWPLRAALAAGLLAGIGLFVKRLVTPTLASISCPDDFASNLLADGLLALALAATWGVAVPSFLIWSAAILLYIPFGKIRHCVFFFYTRVLFGRWFGRRGVFGRGGA